MNVPRNTIPLFVFDHCGCRRGFFDPGTLAVNDAQSQPSPHTPVQEVGEEDVEVELVSSL